MLLEHLKEHMLHGDLRAEDTLYFHTSPAWMMWNWQLSALAVGASIVLYSGRVFDASTLWSIVASEQVTAFGTGPPYLQFCETSGFVPRDEYDLSRLRVVMSTGAILRDSQFDWVIENVADVPIHSISGGTDIVGCFVLGSPLVPVYRGECQCRSLGLDVRALDADPVTGIGELICANPFPSRPLGLYGDPDGTRFHDAYFAQHDGVWTHGDLIEITDHGSARMHGRSDSVLNVGGVRIGPAEIYAIVNALPGVQESIVVEQQVTDRLESSRLVLLVVMTDAGHARCGDGVDDPPRAGARRVTDARAAAGRRGTRTAADVQRQAVRGRRPRCDQRATGAQCRSAAEPASASTTLVAAAKRSDEQPGCRHRR